MDGQHPSLILVPSYSDCTPNHIIIAQGLLSVHMIDENADGFGILQLNILSPLLALSACVVQCQEEYRWMDTF